MKVGDVMIRDSLLSDPYDDWFELGVVCLYGNTLVIETWDFTYMLNHAKWIRIGEL